MATLPSLTETIDDTFMNTWYEIRSDMIDNVLESNVFWLALREFGCLKSQVGGRFITRSIGYGQKTTQRFQKGSVLDQSIVPADTMGIWQWRFFLTDVNRTYIDDRVNSGPLQIKSYLARRLEVAREALTTDIEKYAMQWGGAYDAPLQMNGLWNINPSTVTQTAAANAFSDTENNSPVQATGTDNGNISRAGGNTWWRNWVMAAASQVDSTKIAGAVTNPYSLNLVPDMDHLFNCISANRESPNFILTEQNIYEAYTDEVRDKYQIVRNGFSELAQDLGFETVTYRGATMTWTPWLAGSYCTHFLNMNHIDVVYHPNAWFDMDDWKETASQLERVAYIVCMTTGLLTAQPRRHGVLEYTS